MRRFAKARSLLAVLLASTLTGVSEGETGEDRAATRGVRGRPSYDRQSGSFPRVHDLYFTRAVYSSGRGRWGFPGGRGAWAVDYPKADRQFLVVLKRLMRVDVSDREYAISLADPEIRKFPFLYAVEVGRMDLTDAEVVGLRGYLEAGGFLVVDDFWGTWEWSNFAHNIRRVLPNRPIVDLPPEHEIFSTFYDIEEVLQVPGRGGGIFGRPTYQRDGYTPHARGIFDDEGRLAVLINFNTDLGDAWEWAEDPYYPLKYSTYAFEMGVNMVVYGMSH